LSDSLGINTASNIVGTANTITTYIPAEVPSKRKYTGARYSMKAHTLKKVPGYSFAVYPRDIPDPPPISYASNMTDLVEDWNSVTSPAVVVVSATPIRLAHWLYIYRHIRPEVWNEIKGKWRIWRVSSVV
jgi:hypothetical protein